VESRRQIIATTHVDRHGEQPTRSALESLVERLESYYIPVGPMKDWMVLPVKVRFAVAPDSVDLLTS
jgi:hypothetical protein